MRNHWLVNPCLHRGDVSLSFPIKCQPSDIDFDVAKRIKKVAAASEILVNQFHATVRSFLPSVGDLDQRGGRRQSTCCVQRKINNMNVGWELLSSLTLGMLGNYQTC